MPLSKREFYDSPYWKEKRYSTVIYQSGKNPADFEFVEQQDIKTFEEQQAVCAIAKCGCIADGFRVDPLATPTANTVRIYQGRMYAQSFHSGEEFTGVRIDLPDVLTTFPSLTYEHAVDGNGYFVYDFSAEQSTIPPAGSYRYDMIYIEFWRKEYQPTDDPEMQDATLGETAFREKWYYEFHFHEGNNTNMNPDVPALAAGHYGMRLAVIKRQNTAIVDQESLIDVRHKFSPSQNMLGTNTITVGSVGGSYENIVSAISSRTGVNGVIPTLTDPAVVKIMPGIFVTAFPLNLGTMEGIRIVGSGIDKTIIEFNDLNSLSPAQWIDIGATGGIEFSDMTIRFESTYSANAYLANINGGKVTFRNCKIGEVNTAMSHGGFYIEDATVNFINCELTSRSATKPCINMTGTSVVSIDGCVLNQSQFKVINNETLLNGMLFMSDSRAFSTVQGLYLNGISDLRSCYISKEAWLAGDSMSAGNLIHGLAPLTIQGSKLTGSNDCVVEVEDDTTLSDCIHTGQFINDDVSIVKVIGCRMTNARTDNGATTQFTGCNFHVTDGSNAVHVNGTCAPIVSQCQFYLDNISAVGVYVATNTSAPVVTNCSFFGHASALMFDAGTVVSIKAGHISGDITLKGANVTFTNIEQTI